MARYRKVEVKTWSDTRFRGLTPVPPCGQGLWLWFLTGTRTTNVPGVVIGSDAVMAAELGWPLKAFLQAFAEVFDKGMAKADWKAGVVWLPNASRPHENRNKPESPNVIRSWRDTWDEVPECDLKLEIWRQLKDFTEAFGEGFGQAFVEACREPFRKPLANQEQEQEQEQKQEKDIPVAQERDAGAVERIFEHWRSEYRHPKASLDSKRRKTILSALRNYDEETLREAISGYRMSPHHMGVNDRHTVYDDIGLFLRDATHIDAGLRFARTVPRGTRLQRDALDV